MRLLEQPALALQKGAVRRQWCSRVQDAARAVNGWLAYTERLRSSLIALISILRRPMVATVDA
jgi:hypothetical protein